MNANIYSYLETGFSRSCRARYESMVNSLYHSAWCAREPYISQAIRIFEHHTGKSVIVPSLLPMDVLVAIWRDLSRMLHFYALWQTPIADHLPPPAELQLGERGMWRWNDVHRFGMNCE